MNIQYDFFYTKKSSSSRPHSKYYRENVMKNLLVSKLSLNKFFKTIFKEHTEFLGGII